MATIASLAVNLIAQTSRFIQPVRAAERTVERFNRVTDRTTASLDRVSKGTNHARMQYLALSATYVVMTKRAMEYAGSVMAVHKQTGLAVESVQALRFAAERSDTDIATLETGLRSLVRRAAEAAQGNQSFAKGFDRLGVKVLDANGRLKDTETLIMEVADGAARMASEAEASAALMMVVGDAGRRLVPFMRQGSTSIRELMNEAVSLGIVMDKNAVAALANLGDEVGTTGNRIGAMTRDLAYRLTPAAMVVLGWVNLLIDAFFNLSAEQRQNIVRWTAYIGMILGAVTAVGVLARVLVSGMGILRSFGIVAGLAFNPLTLKLLAVGALVGLAIAHFDDLKAWWENSAFGQVVANAWKDLEETWLSDELTLPEKALATVKITVGAVLGLVDSIIGWWLDTTITLAEKTAEILGLNPEESALIGFLRKIRGWWENEDLTFAEKVVEIAKLIPGVRWVVGFVEDVKKVWDDEELTFREKMVETFKLLPGASWLTGFVAEVKTIWANEELTFPEKLVEIARLIPGVTAIENMIAEIKGVWTNEDLSLGEKFVETIKVIGDTIEVEGQKLAFLFGAAITASYVLDALGDAIRTIPGLLALTEGGNLLRLTIAGLILSLAVFGWKFSNADPEARENILGQIDNVIDTVFPDGIATSVKAAIRFTVELTGAMFDAIKKGLNEGDWSDVFSVGADIWRTGVKIAVTLELARATASLVLGAIVSALGLSKEALASLGVPAAIGALTVVVALAEAQATGDYEKFGADLIAALAAGIGIGIFTGSPYAGALAFTIVLNFEVGSWIADQLDTLAQFVDEKLKPFFRPEAPDQFSPRVEQPVFPVPQFPTEEVIQEIIDAATGRVRETTVSGIDIDEATMDLFARLVTAEAAIDGYEGMLAAAAVVMNRVASEEFPNSIREVIEQTNAFTPVLTGTINEVEATADAFRAVKDALRGIDPTGGATYFRNPNTATSGWFQRAVEEGELVPVTRIGHHEFYKDMGSFASGTTWTGWGPVDEVAGVVHRREAVIPWSALRKGPVGVLEFLGVPGFQEGRGEGVLRTALEFLRPTLEGLSPGLTDTLLMGLDGLEQGIDWARDAFRELMKAIEEGPQAVDEAITSARNLADELETGAQRQDALNQLTATMIARMPIVNALLKGLEAGAAFGPTGSIIGALIAVAMESDTVAHGFRMVNEILGTAANALGMLLDPLLPLIYVLQAVLVPMFNVLGTVLQSVLLPIMPWVFEALKWLGVVVLFVAEVFQRVRGFILDAVGGLVWGIGKAIDSLLGWLTSAGRNLMASGDAMKASAKAAYESADELNQTRRDLVALTYEEALARARSTETIERATGAMINIPQGFRYALARAEAATLRPVPADVTPSPATVHPRESSGSAGLSGRGSGVVVINGDVYGWDDFKRKVQQAEAEIKRDGGFASFGFGGATT